MVITVDAHHAHEIGDDTNRGFGAINFRLYCKFVGGGRLTIDGVARAPAEISSRFNGGLGVSQCISHCLMLNDRMDTAASLGAGEVQRELERRPHECNSENTDQGSGPGETGCSQCKAAAFLPQQIMSRRGDIFETKLRREVRAVADGINCTLEDDAGRRSFNRYDGNRLVGRSVGVQFGTPRTRHRRLCGPTRLPTKPIFSGR